MQVRCRRLEFFNNRENKVKSGNSNQERGLKNCAIRDAMAQCNLKWRNIGGAVWISQQAGRARHSVRAVPESSTTFAEGRGLPGPTFWKITAWRFNPSAHFAYICSTTSMPSTSSPCFKTRAVKSHNASRESRVAASSAFSTGQFS